MSPEEVVLFSLISILGALLFAMGVFTRLGYFRAIYAAKGHIILTPPALVHVATLIGFGMMFMGFLPLLPIAPEQRGDLVVYILLPLLIAIYVLAILQPWWLKPAWLRWIEQEHGDVIELLWEEVRNDWWAWERQVRTQAQLEAWVAEVRHKHGQGHPDAGNPFT
jgi:hypothetical protein